MNAKQAAANSGPKQQTRTRVKSGPGYIEEKRKIRDAYRAALKQPAGGQS